MPSALATTAKARAVVLRTYLKKNKKFQTVPQSPSLEVPNSGIVFTVLATHIVVVDTGITDATSYRFW